MTNDMAMPTARATHEQSRKRLCLTVGIAIALAGCSNVLPNPKAREYENRLNSCVEAAHGAFQNTDPGVVRECRIAADRAQGIAAGTGETGTGSTEGKSPVRKDAPGDHSTLYGAEPDKDGEA